MIITNNINQSSNHSTNFGSLSFDITVALMRGFVVMNKVAKYSPPNSEVL